MKKLKCILLISIIFLTFSCDKDKETQNSSKGNYFIKGTVAFASDSILYLQQIIGNNIKKIDSVSLKGKTTFEFKGKLPEVGFYRVELKEKGASVFALDNAEIQLDIKGNEALPLFEIKGSSLNDDFEEIAAIQQKFRKKIDSLNQQYILAENMKVDMALQTQPLKML
jgi:hypothetical protein